MPALLGRGARPEDTFFGVAVYIIIKRVSWPNKNGKFYLKRGYRDVVIWTFFEPVITYVASGFPGGGCSMQWISNFFTDHIMQLVLHVVYRELYLVESGLLRNQFSRGLLSL